MTNTPGEGQTPPDPSSDQPTNQPTEQPGGESYTEPIAGLGGDSSGERQGYWEQQARAQGGYSYPPPPGQPGSYPPGYQGAPPGYYAPPAAYQYAPDHPKTTTILVLGLLGVLLCQVLSPFAWVMGKRTLQEIDASRGTVGGRSTVQVGYVLGIVGTVILGVAVLAFAVWLFFMVLAFGGAFTSSEF